MGAGNDTVDLANNPPIELAGSLTVDGGDGANQVFASDLTVARGVTIRNGTNAAGKDTIAILNLNVGGSVTIANGDGDTDIGIRRNAAGASAIGGNLSITNGTGQDRALLGDLNIGRNLTIRNGHGGAIAAGPVSQFNEYNATRSIIRGSVAISYLDGGGATSGISLSDAEVFGNYTVNFGTSSFSTILDGYNLPLPVIVHGNVTITGTGHNDVAVGHPMGTQGVGLIVGRNFTVTTGAGADDIHLNRLTVGGATRLSFGDGANKVSIDDSLFLRTFTLTLGGGNDVVQVDTTTGTTAATTFGGSVRMSLGAGGDHVILAGALDFGQQIMYLGPFVIFIGSGADLIEQTLSHQNHPLTRGVLVV
jgi:hypothetical protein